MKPGAVHLVKTVVEERTSAKVRADGLHVKRRRSQSVKHQVELDTIHPYPRSWSFWTSWHLSPCHKSPRKWLSGLEVRLLCPF